ncbi:MAG: DNA primase [Candidatus Wildermuthbacteria bacterium RIFCSPLOWO2_01_FULL_47_18]|uniref:DNA primase n=1 Tax=Candidatus Wildermuthbacteria bacterium RIFCSPLOWO2_01_FULL_47_18 TaxID=1802460 RepID=A0A1G2RIF1_9BACT|nr:MAG: DNA primase [Candidatus Wildermuthbacteria bacterium RIFCSPLOWO2_01_FULL_47_18]
MFTSPVEEIKGRLDIQDVVGQYVKLQKAGANMRALCPFHSEKTPSFFVSPARQSWRCFGCGVGGDMFKFIMQIEGVEFGDALRTLAKRAGVELKRQSPFFEKIQTEKKVLFEIVEWAAKFFEKQLESKTGESARQYLLKRGLTEESIKNWRLGYAPESARSLLEFLQSKGFSDELVGKAGLLVWVERERFDRFRSRVIFPIADLNSQVVGFGGRIFGEKANDKTIAKYLNTSNTPLYDKSKTLYGLDKAKLEIRKQDNAILVEGYMDAILASQADSSNVVAVSGTALTISHLKILKRYSQNLILSFDMDLGGDIATRRGIDLAIGEGFSVKVVSMPEGKDPADVVQKDPSLWQQALSQAQPIFDFSFQRALNLHDKTTPEGKKAIANLLLPLLKRIPNRIEQSHWIGLLSKELDVKEDVIETELKKLKEDEVVPIFIGEDSSVPKQEQKTRKGLVEERVFVLLFRDPGLLKEVGDRSVALFSLPAQEILQGMSKNPTFDFKEFEHLFPEETVDILNQLALKADVEQWEEEQDQGETLLEFQKCLGELLKLDLKEKLDKIAKEIKLAEELRDGERVKTLMEEFQRLSETFHLSH